MPYIYDALLERDGDESLEKHVRLSMPAREGQTVTIRGEAWVVKEIEDTGPDLDGILHCRPAA
jgi:hypothetical protein